MGFAQPTLSPSSKHQRGRAPKPRRQVGRRPAFNQGKQTRNARAHEERASLFTKCVRLPLHELLQKSGPPLPAENLGPSLSPNFRALFSESQAPSSARALSFIPTPRGFPSCASCSCLTHAHTSGPLASTNLKA